MAWFANLKSIPLRLIWDQPQVIYVDATPQQLGFVHDCFYYALPIVPSIPIYVAELLAVITAMYYALLFGISELHIFSDNMGAIGTTNRLRGYFTPSHFMPILYFLKRRFMRFSNTGP